MSDLKYLQQHLRECLKYKHYTMPIHHDCICKHYTECTACYLSVVEVYTMKWLVNHVHIFQPYYAYIAWFTVRILLLNGNNNVTVENIKQMMNECPQEFIKCFDNEQVNLCSIVNKIRKDILTYPLRIVYTQFTACELPYEL